MQRCRPKCLTKHNEVKINNIKRRKIAIPGITISKRKNNQKKVE